MSELVTSSLNHASNQSSTPNSTSQSKSSDWKRYRSKHRWDRVEDFPRGINPPQKVRIYSQNDYYRLQWWEPSAKRNLTDRVEGDLVAAIMRAREIDERLLNSQSSGLGLSKLTLLKLHDDYVAMLQTRTDADEISPKTLGRYSSALKHFLEFVSQSEVQQQYRYAANVDQRFVLSFKAFLSNLKVPPNGHPHATPRPLKSIGYVIGVTRGMFSWGTSEKSGPLLPTGFRNPFRENVQTRKDRRAKDLFGDPDVTVEMASKFLQNCDAFQLHLFTPIILFGLRASEPCLIFREDLDTEWLRIIGRPELGYDTKGLRDKRLPLSPELYEFLTSSSREETCLLLTRRTIFEEREQVTEPASSVTDLVDRYRQQCERERHPSATSRARISQHLFKEAGGLDYDHIDREFRTVAGKLGWSKEATLKDFRHLFSTSLENAGVPLFYRRYLMGQSPGTSPLTTYTHLNQLREQHQRAVESTLAPLYQAFHKRVADLGENR
ncbi:hypothetical protein [Thalassoglobus sp.]|uniref:hypothetical protein n=1 Tax=Thalassoglobus sp. TaxID=2795869 RepID=UPI003AA95111